ncbi:hypothetical protein [Legionella impletisoli]|uniref:Uncharacterized protein n=1 Tax=Legionella impletisoli TaxID=343510 RepID=A0A917NAY5_9GAMM|nr:hypothetical protein [Legionella impletisoli]GGI84003.1 hypothetical protein GCM10007966_10810 [Legionella impletisoli]
MKLKFMISSVALGLLLGTSLVNADDVAPQDNQSQITLKTESGQELKCVVAPEHKEIVKNLKKGEKLTLLSWGSF